MSDRYDDGRDISMLIAGFGLGTLVGTVIGLLIAPKSGQELRRDIAGYSRDYYGKAAEYSKEYYDRASEYGRDSYEAGRDKARQAYEQGKNKAREYSSKLGDKITEAKTHLEDAAKRVSDKVKGEGKAGQKEEA